MASSGNRWTVYDRDGNPIYLTEERWRHIVAADNHPEMIDYEDFLRITIQQGNRKQEPLNPRKYRYAHPFAGLPEDMSHIVAIILFGFSTNEQGRIVPNNYVATAFFKHIRSRGE
jgi:hypothetical protein